MDPIVITIFILLVAIALFMINRTTYTTTAMIILAMLYLTGILEAEAIFKNFINRSTLLIINMYVISGAILQSGAALKLAVIVNKKINSERKMILLLMGLSMICSAFFSNMVTAILITTLVLGICDTNLKYNMKKLLMPVAIGSVLGGMLTVVGTPGNMMIREILREAGYETLSFFSFSKIGLPIAILSIVFVYFIGYRFFPSGSLNEIKENSQSDSLEWNRNQVVSIVVFCLVIIGMIFEKKLNIPIHMISFGGTILLLLTRTITEKELFSMINWPATITFVSFLSLGNAMTVSGAAVMIGDGFVKILGSTNNFIVTAAVLFFIVAFATQFMSNGGVAAVFFPIGLSIAQSLDLNPVSVLMIINLGAQASFATPLATPLNAYIMSVGEYKFSDFAKCGIPLIIIAGIVSIFLLPLFWPL